MPDTDRPIAILVAVEEELRALLKRMPPAVVDSAGEFALYRCTANSRPIAIAKSGMGGDRAERAAQAIVDEMHPDMLVIAGFCAGLIPNPGEIVVADTVMRDENSRPDQEFQADPELIRKACEIKPSGIRVHQGRLLTVRQIARTVSQKESYCRDARRPWALDMETVDAAEVATANAIPWISFRAVTDGKLDSLPIDFSRYVGGNGEVNRRRVAGAAVMRPWKIPALLRLGRRSEMAARNLACFVEAFVVSVESSS